MNERSGSYSLWSAQLVAPSSRDGCPPEGEPLSLARSTASGVLPRMQILEEFPVRVRNKPEARYTSLGNRPSIGSGSAVDVRSSKGQQCSQ